MASTIDKEILSLFADGFSSTLNDPGLNKTIQAVKGHLYDRDYLKAFGSETNLFAYFVRWSPARALAYYNLFTNTPRVAELFQSSENRQNTTNVISIGGGAGAEIVALAAQTLMSDNADAQCRLTAIDIGNWDPVIQQAQKYINDTWLPWNQRKRSPEINTPFEVEFIHGDVLTMTNSSDINDNNKINWGEADLITSMFTTNELFAEDKRGTVQLLQRLNKLCKPGALLLIAESAGSYSEIQIGSKKFPVQFLIQHTLQSSWDSVLEKDSQWYRVPQNARYKLALENTHFFLRVYRHK